MAFVPSNPNGMCIGMDITVGALKPEPKKTKKFFKTAEGLVLGEAEFFHGIPPQSKFMDEKYFVTWEKTQHDYKKRLKQIRQKRISFTRQAFEFAHNHLLCLAGPDWYQELSPQQKELIDSLKNVMKKDLDLHLTTATHSALSLLGLRPLPNDSQIWKSLTESYGCPIEFLLGLYELMKPEGKCYSINDRLLLSGVAHLSLRDTLREMHVRFPSPPRPEDKPKTPKPKKPRKKYESVYLVPFTFKWPQRKSTEYRNPVIQKPTCPYFSYICDLNKTRLMRLEDYEEVDRVDDDIKIPCDLFEDHLVAEAYYNSTFKRNDSYKYAIIRPRHYQTCTPRTYPGILPKYLVKKRYPPLIKMKFDVKIHEDISPKTNKKKKLITTTCEARIVPAGRSGQKKGEILIAKYIYTKNITRYSKHKDGSDDNISKGGDYPCSTCGGPEKKKFIPDPKPVKKKSWIKRPRKPKKKRKILNVTLSEFLITDKSKHEIVVLDEETIKMKEENQKYIKTWENLFENIEKMEKLKLETEECVCPGRSKKVTKLEPENDCTCAVWNLPPPPKVIPPKISCECSPTLEEAYVPPREDKCDCKKKAREAALEACEKCGAVLENQDGECSCTKNLNACDNCVKNPPSKLLSSDDDKICECNKKNTGKQELTVAYVFIDPHITPFTQSSHACECEVTGRRSEDRNKAEGKKVEGSNAEANCTCSVQNETEQTALSQTKRPQERQVSRISFRNVRKDNEVHVKERTSKIGTYLASEKSVTEKENKCLLTCGKLMEMDRCQRETSKLLNLLKCNCPKCQDLRKKYRARYVQAGTRDACGGILPVIGGTYGMSEECACLEKFEERFRGINDYKRRMRAKCELKSQKNLFIINGVHQTKNGPIYNISGVIPTIPCDCPNEEELATHRKKLEKLTNSIKKGYKYTISGIKEGSSQNQFILGGITKECECLGVYNQFIEEHNACLIAYEKYLQYMSREIQAYMQEMKERYKNPPLTGQKLIENELKNMTGAPGLPLPEGKSEYLVSGVQVNDLGKSFILGGVLLNEEEKEECSVTVESYTRITDKKNRSAAKCQRSYLCNYMTFGRNCGNPFKISPIPNMNSSNELICQCISYDSIESEESHKENENVEKQEREIDSCPCECPCGVEIEQPEDCSCKVEKKVSEESCICEELVEEEDEEDEKDVIIPEGCTCNVVEKKSSEPIEDPCLCDIKNCGCQVDEVCVKECFYGPMEAWWSNTDLYGNSTKKSEEPKIVKLPPSETIPRQSMYFTIGGPSKRFVILRKIPKDKDTQTSILKKLLKGMADDGYPLAKLPDSHRIPYFWLWFQFRMRKRWNYNDAVKNYKHVQALWNHIDLCGRKIPPPKLPLHCVCEGSNFTWREAPRVFKMIRETKQKYYDTLRKNMVDFAREFYSSISPYQYPNPPYLNHYFYAYQPSKPENVIAEYVWQGHEHKDPSKYRSCLCK